LSEQTNNESGTDSRDAKLIECLQAIEANLSEFLSKKDDRGLSVLMEGVGKLSADPDAAIEILRAAFGSVVDPVLLSYFDGTWMAFLLWNDFARQVQILYNYSRDKESPPYKFVSGFVRSQAFSQFKEPMTDIIFTEITSEKHVMIFSWDKHPEPEVLKRITDMPENTRPLLVAFDNLGGKWEHSIDDIQKFVETAAQCEKAVMREENFSKLAEKISSLSSEILSDPEVIKILQDAQDAIDSKFKLVVSDDVERLGKLDALCRTLIWNRLFDQEWRYLYYIPAKFLVGSAVSGIVCAFKEILPPRDYVVLTQIVNRIFSLFHFGSYGQQLNLFALRSATAAIMARNKSHIHGSHIEHGLRNKMEDFSKVIQSRLTSEQPFYRSLREKLGILDDSTPRAALEMRIDFIEELGKKLVEAEGFVAKLGELENNRRDINLLEDINEWMAQASAEEMGS
jgi:hypothetical protein